MRPRILPLLLSLRCIIDVRIARGRKPCNFPLGLFNSQAPARALVLARCFTLQDGFLRHCPARTSLPEFGLQLLKQRLRLLELNLRQTVHLFLDLAVGPLLARHGQSHTLRFLQFGFDMAKFRPSALEVFLFYIRKPSLHFVALVLHPVQVAAHVLKRREGVIALDASLQKSLVGPKKGLRGRSFRFLPSLTIGAMAL
jgi:hypothetical protein